MSDIDHCDECNVFVPFADQRECCQCGVLVCGGCWDYESELCSECFKIQDALVKEYLDD